jgi:hypothetical protein
MADPNKYKSVSVPLKTYKMLAFLSKGHMGDEDLNLTISKTIELLATKMSKEKGYNYDDK